MNRRTNLRVLALAAGSLLGMGQLAHGINITLNYQAATSTPPAADPNGTQLQAIMNHVRAFYNDVFEDAHNITINFRYGTQPAGTLAAHSLNSQGGNPHRQTQGTIVFSNTVNWFYDPTPADNSEFNMTQTLWRDLTATQRTNFYNAGTLIPQTFEVGFTGTNNNTNPNVAGRTDLVSVAFHEVGHALGMSAANTATQNQTADGDYDFNSSFVFGRTLAARTATATNIAHLAASPAVMFPSIGTGIRRLPSHTDLFSMASGHSYLLLDVPRREFYGGTDWHVAGNWSGNRVPGSDDDVYVRDARADGGAPVFARLIGTGVAADLFVSEASGVITNSFALNVRSASVRGLNSYLLSSNGGTLNASAEINITDSASLQITDATAVGSIINNHASIVGRGTLRVGSTLNNMGVITTSGGTLVLARTGSGTLNLDGNFSLTTLSEPGVVRVLGVNAALIVAGPLSDDFNGLLDIGGNNGTNSFARFDFPWTLGAGPTGTILLGTAGRLTFTGGGFSSAAASRLEGAAVTAGGIITVPFNRWGRVLAPINFQNTVDVLVESNGVLSLENVVTYNGGTHTGSGRIIWDGNVTIAGNTTIGASQLDLDGSTSNTVTVNFNTALTINSQLTDPASGTIVINGGLHMNGSGSWTNDTGTVIMNAGVLGGSRIFNNQSRLTVNAGVSTFLAASNFAASSQNVINGTLRLNAPATISGGNWTGTGTLVFDDHAHRFTANTTIGVANIDLDGLQAAAGSVTVNPGVLVTLNTNITDILDAVINLDSGTMAFNVGSPVQNRGVINLTNTGGGTPRVAGQPVELLTTGRINTTGVGQLFSGLRFSSGTVNMAAGGNLSVSNQFSGLAGSTLNKIGAGALTIPAAQNHAAGATLNILEGVVTLQSDAGAGGQNLTINHLGTTLNLQMGQRLAALNVGTNSFVAMNPPGNTSVLRVRDYQIAGLFTPAGAIDLADETMIFDYTGFTPLGRVTGDVTAGYNGGDWNGMGIRSSFAAANPNQFAVGVVEATDIGSPATFAGQAIDSTTLIIRFTRLGDANLDRVVNIADFSIVGANFNQSGRWATGDFNFDNVVTIADFSLLAANFNLGVPAGDAMGGSPVPEPSTVAALALLAMGLPRRRARA